MHAHERATLVERERYVGILEELKNHNEELLSIARSWCQHGSANPGTVRRHARDHISWWPPYFVRRSAYSVHLAWRGEDICEKAKDAEDLSTPTVLDQMSKDKNSHGLPSSFVVHGEFKVVS